MDSETLSKLWVVEYSHSEGAFNTQTLIDALQDNMRAFLEARRCDYSIIAVAGTSKEANKLCAALKIREDRAIPFEHEHAHQILTQIDRYYKGFPSDPVSKGGLEALDD